MSEVGYTLPATAPPPEAVAWRPLAIDGEAGWRVLMMHLEHEVYHRSQIDAYAGLQGWPVPDIFNSSAEYIGTLQADQRARYGG